MIHAAELVKQCTLSIKQIALDCGYSDMSNFYRDFKSIHRITPRELQFRELTAPATVSQANGESRFR